MTAKIYNDGKPLYRGPNGEKVLPSELSGLMGCCWTLSTGMKFRGLPRDAVELKGSAREELLNNLKGYWKLQPLSGAGRNTIAYTDVFVEGDKAILSGGMHNSTQYVGNYNGNGGVGRHITTAVANQAQEQKILPYRSAARGTLYMDNIGSLITRVAPDGSEIEISNALCMKMKWVRPWKLNGQPNPNAGNATTGTTDDELTRLEKLRKDGILSDEEYTKLKIRVMEGIFSA